MTFYKIWYKGNKRGTNFLVSADDTAEAKQLVVDHLNRIANFHTSDRFDVGYATKDETDWRTVTKKMSNPWAVDYTVKLTAWEEWLICKDINLKKMILEYSP
jgi:hypothetical protein